MDGQALRRRRRALDLSQTELGDLLDLTQNTISRWEQGTAVIGHPRMLDLAMETLERELQERDSQEQEELAIWDSNSRNLET